ncbi:MAG: hypothetical protein ACI9TA_000996 [Reinekea sp.]|jgi:hypothetical protein
MPSVLPHPRWALTPPFHRYLHIEGSLFSVALSLGLPPLGITQHRAFHGVRTFLEVLPPRDHPTTRVAAATWWQALRQRGIGAPSP